MDLELSELSAQDKDKIELLLTLIASGCPDKRSICAEINAFTIEVLARIMKDDAEHKVEKV